MKIIQLKTIKDPFSKIYQRYEGDIFSKQQLTVLLYSAITIAITIPLNIFGISGPSNNAFTTINAVWITLMITNLTLLFLKILSLKNALRIHFLLAQTSFCLAIIYTGINPTPNAASEIVADMLLSTAVISLAMAAFLRRTPYILSAMALTTYISTAYILELQCLKNYFPIFAIVLIMICILGEKLLISSHKIEKEHNVLKTEEKSILNMLGLEKYQAVALAKYTEKDALQNASTEDFKKILGESARQRLLSGVAEQIRKERMDEETLNRIFPELSPSERKICRLILQGRKQGDICNILQTTKGNVTSQRSHIRAKLGIGQKENLREFLIKRMNNNGIEI